MSHGHVSSVPWRSESRLQVVHSALPSALLSDSELPFAYDWRAVNGRSFVTADANQHLPQPCGSSWVHATAAALDDRIKIARRAKAPDVQLSRQALLNCVPGPRASPPPGCSGGDAWMVHEYLEHSVVPDETCQPYTARNGVCEPMGQCRSCPPWAAGAITSPACLSLAAPSYVGYGVAEYGSVRGEVAMMKEILLRGPIVCSLVAGPPSNPNPDPNPHPNPNPNPNQVAVGVESAGVAGMLGSLAVSDQAADAEPAAAPAAAAAPAVPAEPALSTRHGVCVITGLPAKYKDPQTGLAYANLDAYKELRKLHPAPEPPPERDGRLAPRDEAAEGGDGGEGGEGGDGDGGEGGDGGKGGEKVQTSVSS